MKRCFAIFGVLAVIALFVPACGGGGGGGGGGASPPASLPPTSVALFADNTYVDYDTTNPTWSEVNTLNNTLLDYGFTVSTFTGITDTDFSAALAGKDVLVIPELEKADLNAAISGTTRSVIANFVDNDGTLLIFYPFTPEVGLLNSVFGFSLVNINDTGTISLNASATTALRFENGPATLPPNSATHAVTSASLPPGAKALYTDTAGNSVVTMIPYGTGYVFVMGWDWYNAQPTGTLNGEWLGILATAVNLKKPLLDAGIAVAGFGLNTNRLDVKDKLFGTGLFNTLNIMDFWTTTPSVSELREYDSILFSSDDVIWGNTTNLGNNFADYVDGGGGVTLNMSANVPPYALGGRFTSDNYFAIAPTIGWVNFVPATLGTVFNASHPVMSNVNSFDGGALSLMALSPGVVPGAELIANWSSGIPLIAARTINGVRRADLNFYPVSADASANFWDTTTDGDRLMGNSLDWVAQFPGPYVSSNVPLDIDSGAAGSCTVASTISVGAGPSSLNKVTIYMNISHTWDIDLDIFLESPTGTTVELSTDNGASQDNYTNTSFNDTSSTSIVAGTAPFIGNYTPEQPLSNFEGENAIGTWTLHVYDDVCGIDSGSLDEWSLIIR